MSMESQSSTDLHPYSCDMQTILHVSKSATQETVDELYEIGTLAGESTKKSIEGPILELLTEAIQETNPFGFLSRSGPFGTDHKRSRFLDNKIR